MSTCPNLLLLIYDNNCVTNDLVYNFFYQLKLGYIFTAGSV